MSIKKVLPLRAKGIIFLLPILCFWSLLFAASTDTGEFVLDIPSMSKLSIQDADQVINLLQGASGEDAYEAGYIDADPAKPKLIVDANSSWKLSVSAIMEWELVGSYQKASSDLLLKVNSTAGHQTGFGSYAPISLIDQEIASSSSGADNENYGCNYRILLDWQKDIPGVYVIILTYTLSTQPT